MQIVDSYTCQAFRKQDELPKILGAFLVVVVVLVVATLDPGKVKVSASSIVLYRIHT